MIELKNVSKRYTTTTFGVRELNFEIRDQEFLVIYGPSGAGKSTTLKLLAGIIKPTSGEIERDGQSLLDVAPESRDMAMAFENYALYSHMSVKDNLAFPLRARAMSKEEIDERVDRMARTLQITDLTRPSARIFERRSAPACGVGTRHHPPCQPVSARRAYRAPGCQTTQPHARRAQSDVG